jgi:putative glutamine amidotransferase
MKKLTIGITDSRKYGVYAHWLARDRDVEVLRLGYASDNFHDITRCQGILLTGGDEDIHPRFYNRTEYLSLCTGGLDERRDEFELRVVDYTQSNRLPVLGICRGLQITNIFLGGTLHPDIPSLGKSNHSKSKEGHDRYHELIIERNTELEKITRFEKGDVNSAHHQSADLIGDGLRANAFSMDEVIEGLERTEPRNKPYLMLVQWHPERMGDQDSPMVGTIKASFLDSMR